MIQFNYEKFTNILSCIESIHTANQFTVLVGVEYGTT